MNNIWHWQQYFTMWGCIVSVIIQLLIAGMDYHKTGGVLLTIAAALFGQWVLYTGGWYGTF
jgi:hypothetical protein